MDQASGLASVLSYDFHNVLDMHWADTREFRERIFQEKPPWVDIQELVLSFSGVARARESQATLRRELPGIEFVRSRDLVGREAILRRFNRERHCDYTCHIDDRSDIVEDVRGAGLTAFHLDYRNVWLSELASDIVSWLWSLWLCVIALDPTLPNIRVPGFAHQLLEARFISVCAAAFC